MATMKTLNGYGFNATEFNGKAASDYLQKTDTATNSAKLGGKAPEYYINPKNLLRNANFREPVNTVGFSSGSTVGTWAGETVNEWYAYSNGATITLTSSGISLLNGIYQEISAVDLSRYEGKTLTFAAKINGVVYAAQGAVNQTGAWHIIGESVTPYGKVRAEIQNDNKLFCIISNDTEATIEWIALYEGTYTADNVPPPFFYPQRLEMLNLGLPIQPRNLLDNSDFRNPVNQRGITSETSVSAYSYFIDRWVNQSSEARSFTLSTSGIGLPPPTTLLQKIEKIEAGKIVTFAIKLSDGTIATLTGTVQYASDGAWMRFASIAHSFGDMYMETMNGVVNVVVYNTKVITIEWAALYEGSYTADTLPPYVPKGYAAELEECRRYYKRFTAPYAGIAGTGYVTGSTKYIYINPPDNYPMRIDKPSFAFKGVINVRGINGYIVEDYKDAVIRVYENATGCIPTLEIVRRDSAAWNATNNTPVAVQFHANSVLELIADL